MRHSPGMGWHRRRGAVLVGAALSAAALAFGGCAAGAPEAGVPQASASGWTRAADFPWEPRTSPVVVWTDAELIVVGGDAGPPCPPAASCASWGHPSRQGASFDPARGTWRKIADAPVDIPASPSLPPSPVAYAGGSVFVVIAGADSPVLLSYDVAADAWRQWDAPERLPATLVGDGDRVLFFSGSDEQGELPDMVLDVPSGEWSALPPDPIGPAFDRVLTPTPEGIVLTAKELLDDPGADEPAVVLAALFDEGRGAWTLLPDTRQIGGWQWIWSGERLVDPQPGGADGGEVGNWGAQYPYGGVLTVPDGVWSPLPDPPDAVPDAWVTAAAGGGRFAVGGGHVYDDEQRTWARLDPPPGAPQEAGPAIWADERLVVVGGTDWSGQEGTLHPSTWVYAPPGTHSTG